MGWLQDEITYTKRDSLCRIFFSFLSWFGRISPAWKKTRIHNYWELRKKKQTSVFTRKDKQTCSYLKHYWCCNYVTISNNILRPQRIVGLHYPQRRVDDGFPDSVQRSGQKAIIPDLNKDKVKLRLRDAHVWSRGTRDECLCLFSLEEFVRNNLLII